MATALIILAAGKGTRMKSDLPKVLHKVAETPLLAHAMRAGGGLAPERTIIVAGHGAEQVEAAAREADPAAQIAMQDDQLGTAHAVAQAAPLLTGFQGDAIVLYGDTPFIRPDTLDRMARARAAHDIVVLGFEAADPGRYGRLVMQGDRLERIVEFNDASAQERALTFCNSGVLAADAATLFDLVSAVGNDNAKGEYYLTDVVALAKDRGLSATAVACDEAETMGVNSRADLAAAEAAFQARARRDAMDNGVTLTAPETVYFAFDTSIGPDAVVEPHVVFGPGVTVEGGARIRAFSHLEGCHVAGGAVVGPYARLRPGTRIAQEARIGNFVEIKNAAVETGAKVNHLSYIGDAHLGAQANIGAGTVTCNYDGVSKHHTAIGAGAFIGSDTMLVAPVTVGDGAMTASGSVITRDVPAEALAIARGQQVNKPGMARRLFEKLKKTKKKDKTGEVR
ncbi:bifunctional UDP-N-acetylglucosamine diphosphorylase/glucosamine-1-phosphate N-acetyltransferase GlmU [Roseovarius salis]|uniref:bifunctional UDP-N-acetylglucosamine diphosphorylase/glucosamine-1-phosphate N-acetyltransferase GlmU n=1 Tax=Roseovarius salis TaxID=3376063 RepID=UPI0037C546DC